MGIGSSIEDGIKKDLKNLKDGHIMLIDGMSKLWTHQVKTCQSSVFEVSGHKWKLIVYPSGINGTSDHVSLHLRLKDKKSLGSNGQVECCVNFLVLFFNTLMKMWHSSTMNNVCYNAKQAIHGKDRVMEHEWLKKNHIKDDKVVLLVEITNVKSNCAVNTVPRTIGTAERLKLEEMPPNKSRFTWKITRFSSFKGEYRLSPEFTVGQRRWQLMMYPKGTSSGKGYMSVFFATTDKVTNGPKAKTLAVRKLRVLDQLHGNHYESTGASWYHYNNLDRQWGQDKFLSLQKLNDPSKGYLVKDEMYLGVEFLLVSTTEYL